MMTDTIPGGQGNRGGHAAMSAPAGRAVVLGLGVTGLSVARYLTGLGWQVLVADSRETPPGIEGLKLDAPGAELVVGRLDLDLPADVDQVIVSPGLPLDLPVIREARRRGVEVVGDIELFARVVERPVAAITGSNGKSTVTTMVAAAAVRAGRQMPAGGNLGTPALNLLDMPADGFLLELSSFQLELTDSLRPRVAAVLNVSVDHIDRHGSLASYAAAKARILTNAEWAVLNRHDALVMGMTSAQQNSVTFGSDAPPTEDDYGVLEADGRRWLARGGDRLMPADEIGVPGAHNVLNALAAIAIAEKMGIAGEPVLAALRAYRGLPHRTQLVAEVDGVRWIDDSKATNVGAAVAAIGGMDAPVVLIAGGDGKGADFGPLAEAVRGTVKAVVLLGRDAPALARVIGDAAPCEIVPDMDAAVSAARRVARDGDIVLLSPACASLDMFDNYAARGEAFRRAVLGVCG